MISSLGIFAMLSQAATGSLITAIWQGILLAVAVGLGFRLLPKTPAAVRFAVWFGVLLLVMALPVLALLPHAANANPGGHGPWLTFDSRWSLAIGAVWMLASLCRAATLVWAGWRVRELWKSAGPIALGTASLTAQEGLRRAQVCVSEEVDRPTVIGFFSPKILIPSWLLEKLTPAEVEQIVLHEAGHLGRADDWMNLVQKIALVVFPLNPALAWVERRLCFERELACDERVLRATGSPKAYATCLASLAEHRMGRRGLALALGILGRESELGQRVRRILRRDETMKPLHAKLVLGIAALALLVTAVGVEHCPQLVGFASATPMQVAGNSAHVPTTLSPGFAVEPTLFHEPAQSEMTTVHAARRAAAQRRDQSRSMLAQQQEVYDASGQMQMTVTAWQREDGARVVLTTVRTMVPQRVQREIGDEIVPQESVQQDTHPYVAVPVRGGWLVFQL